MPLARSCATERARPGELVHLDVKKLGRIPPGGGKRFAPGFAETHSGPQPVRGWGLDYVHVAVDDHSRYAYAEALPDERGVTAAAFLERTLAHFEACGVAVERILTDNGKNYISRAFRETAAAYGIRLKRTRPYRPQTNGKAEAFNKILQAEWAYRRPYESNSERLDALPGFLGRYNRRRPHGGIGGGLGLEYIGPQWPDAVRQLPPGQRLLRGRPERSNVPHREADPRNSHGATRQTCSHHAASTRAFASVL